MSGAFSSFLDQPGKVVLCRDPRASGVMLREGVIAGLLACGREVIDLGRVDELKAIEHTPTHLRIGAGACQALLRNPKFLPARTG